MGFAGRGVLGHWQHWQTFETVKALIDPFCHAFKTLIRKVKALSRVFFHGAVAQMHEGSDSRQTLPGTRRWRSR